MKIFNWAKKNKLAAFLLVSLGLAVIFLLGQKSLSSDSTYGGYSPASSDLALESASPKTARSSIGILPPDQSTPPSESSDRLVITETNLSLVVEQVEDAVESIVGRVEDVGGFMVSRSLSQPEEAPYGYLSLRVPSDQVEEVIGYFRSLAVKVVSEQVSARDVTDQYEDIDKKLLTLEETKKRLEEIMAQAQEIEDILAAQREIINLQNQIDSLKGRQEYLEKTARLSLITVHLSTDEMALPYQPSETFRPLVVFKQAVRSMILTLRGVAKGLIWFGVYGAIWLPAVVGIVIIKYLRRKK
ncbi:MAG: DUF4349 domain-containing protein [Patescibacteria group bacterium]|jgi:hypothetical protein